ncbi:hypothetical protein GCM10027280_38460 [Micromonospora polyrhachis]|uniref:Uncharacterized protein n=1 Tax=Micromonospora polyrhachis TaxID=1282883 RepID=A0A7W7STZ1_9ACTN|nr:hypothetical protein [Micromonospora polyrhachis]MBB4959700.1 hypothetical protein [Micromonospora polyrhachis]
MRKILRRPRARSFIAAAAVAGGLVLTMATPASADYTSPLYSTLKACNNARPTYYSSWTVPGPCYKMYDWKGEKVVGYAFLVKTRG